MPIEPPRKISETPVVRREELPHEQQRRKKQPLKKDDQPKENVKPGKVDIKV